MSASALGRPISGTSVTPNADVVPPAPIWAVNLGEIHFDGSVGGSRAVPIAGRTSLGIDSRISFTLATLLKVWDTGPDQWNFASSITVPYVYAKASAVLVVGALQPEPVTQSASNLFDLYFTPVVAGYHISKDENVR